MEKIYFGHPINSYGTLLEEILLTRIRNQFPQYEIENPNQRHHQEGCERWRTERQDPMGYFYNEVLPGCVTGVFLPFRDGKWGAGVFGEADWLAKRGFPIWGISYEGIIKKADLSQVVVLSVDETRARVRNPDKTIKNF